MHFFSFNELPADDPSAVTKIYHLPLQRNTRVYEAYLGFSSVEANYLETTKDEFLHPIELEQYASYAYNIKKQSFLMGRFLAKKVLSAYLGETDLKAIRIKSGVFDQPLVVYKSEKLPAISISHTSGFASCLAFSEEHPMAIDLEVISQQAKESIVSQLTPDELQLFADLPEEENIFYTRLWTIKEALSKVLKTGMMTPFEIYQIKDLSSVSAEGITVSTFTYFEQYQALSFPWKHTICSIVLPKNTSIRLIHAERF